MMCCNCLLAGRWRSRDFWITNRKGHSWMGSQGLVCSLFLTSSRFLRCNSFYIRSWVYLFTAGDEFRCCSIWIQYHSCIPIQLWEEKRRRGTTTGNIITLLICYRNFSKKKIYKVNCEIVFWEKLIACQVDTILHF